MAHVRRLGILFATVIVVAGCARFPEGSVVVPIREMTFTIEFAGPINDNYYYFVPIDVNAEGQGPVPVFPSPGTGPQWLTGSATHYIQYHQRLYTVYRITNLQPLEAEPIGGTINPRLPEPEEKTLRFTIDLNALEASGDSVLVNFMALDDPFSEVRLVDALGPLGGNYLNIEILSDRTFRNNDPINIPELPGDVRNQNMNIQPSNELTDPLDIVDWTITLNL